MGCGAYSFSLWLLCPLREGSSIWELCLLVFVTIFSQFQSASFSLSHLVLWLIWGFSQTPALHQATDMGTPLDPPGLHSRGFCMAPAHLPTWWRLTPPWDMCCSEIFQILPSQEKRYQWWFVFWGKPSASWCPRLQPVLGEGTVLVRTGFLLARGVP